MTSSARVVALDALRGVAIGCMLIAHGVPFFWTTGVSDALDPLLSAINDVASPLFGLVMGAAAALVWSRPETEPLRRSLTDVGRGIVVFVLGVLLVELSTWVAVVLHVLGVLMVIGVPVGALGGAAIRTRRHRTSLLLVLLAVTAVCFALAPWATGLLAPADERVPHGRSEVWSEVWVALVAGQSYRAVSLLPFFALGALLAASGRLGRPRQLALRLLPVAVLLLAAMVVTNDFGGVTLSGDYADQVRDLTLVLGAVTLTAAAATRAQPVTRVLAELGTIALSLYAFQLVVLWLLMRVDVWEHSVFWGWVCFLTLILVPSAALVAWRRLLGPGPLERLIAVVTGKGHAT